MLQLGPFLSNHLLSVSKQYLTENNVVTYWVTMWVRDWYCRNTAMIMIMIMVNVDPRQEDCIWVLTSEWKENLQTLHSFVLY